MNYTVINYMEKDFTTNDLSQARVYLQQRTLSGCLKLERSAQLCHKLHEQYQAVNKPVCINEQYIASRNGSGHYFYATILRPGGVVEEYFTWLPSHCISKNINSLVGECHAAHYD